MSVSVPPIQLQALTLGSFATKSLLHEHWMYKPEQIPYNIVFGLSPQIAQGFKGFRWDVTDIGASDLLLLTRDVNII